MHECAGNACRMQYRLECPKMFPSVLTKQCGEVPAMVDRWHHLVLSLEVLEEQPESS